MACAEHCGCPVVDAARFDFARAGVQGAARPTAPLRRPVRRIDGALVVEAVAAVVGVYHYLRADGGVLRELRGPDALFGAMATLRGRPVTRRHPGEGTRTGARMFAGGTDQAIGRVDSVRREGEALVARLVITDPAAADAIERRELVEVSPGYRVALEPRAGLHRGVAYDARAAAIEYDHVALGPAGWSRCGASCAVRADAADLSLLDQEQLAERIRSERLREASSRDRFTGRVRG